MSTEKAKEVWIQCPCFNEEKNLHVIYERFKNVAEANPLYNFRFLFVDDHSTDNTWSFLELIAGADSRVAAIRLAINAGAHAASSAGLQYNKGDCVIVMSADMQDPPEIIPSMIEKWEQGAKIVWAYRDEHERQNFLEGVLGSMYWFFMRKFVLPETHPRGADLFLADKQVVKVINTIKERNRSLLALLNVVGFEQASIAYHKQKRLHGKSKWRLSRKIKFTIDSIIGNTHLPVRLMSAMGIIISLISFVYGIKVVFNYFNGIPVAGWSSAILISLVIGGFTMTMLGIVGEYLWRILDEVRGRPYFVIEKSANLPE